MLLIPSLKSKTKERPLESIADPKDLYMPLETYGSMRLSPVVEIGEYVKKHQLIASSEGTFAGRLHAPVSGQIIDFLQFEGKPMIHLQNDFMDTEYPIAAVSTDSITLQEMKEMLFEYGIQGAGGSQFPTHLKYNIGQKNIETLIFNGAECEPYLSADFTLMNEKADELMSAAQVIGRVLNTSRLVFAIERQNLSVRKILFQSAERMGLHIEVKILPDTYPQGGELQLIKSVTGMKIRKGSIPADYGILVNNVSTLWAIYCALFEGRPKTERVVTISGNSCQHIGNYLIKVGTPVDHILRETGNSWDLDVHTIVLGGAMMGKAVTSPLTPIHKGAGGVLVMRRNISTKNNCIKCGFCVDVCPQQLMPLEFVRHNIANDLMGLKDFNLQDCIECGACAYVCPSEVPLMESIFDGKAKIFHKSISKAG